MKNLFSLNVLLLLIWVLIIIIDPVYSFLGFVIHGFIQVGMSLVMIFNNNYKKEIKQLSIIHFIGSIVACCLIFTIGIHLKTGLFVIGLLMAIILFFFSIYSTYKCKTVNIN